MDYESMGAGAGTGIISAFLMALGFKSRLDRLEKSVVYRDTCDKCETNRTNQISAMQELHREMREEQRAISSKLDAVLVNLSRRRGDEKA